MKNAAHCFVPLLMMAVFPLLAVATRAGAETLVVHSETAEGAWSSPLAAGQAYLFQASGVASNNSGGSYLDAEWQTQPGSSVWEEYDSTPEGSTGGPWIGPRDILDVFINDTAVDWLGTTDGLHWSPHTFSPSHVYRFYYVGNGEPVKFHIADPVPIQPECGWYGDNSGYLTVEIAVATGGIPLLLDPNPVTLGDNVSATVYVTGAASVMLSFTRAGFTVPGIAMIPAGGDRWAAVFDTDFLASTAASSIQVIATGTTSSGQTLTGSATLQIQTPPPPPPPPGSGLWLWSDDTYAYGLATSSFEVLSPQGVVPLEAKLLMTQDLNLWFGLNVTSSGNATVGSLDDLSIPAFFGDLKLASPCGTVALKGTFQNEGDSVRMALAFDSRGGLMTVAMIVLKVVPGGDAVDPQSVASLLPSLQRISAINSAASAFSPRPSSAYGWSKAIVKAVGSLRALATDGQQRAALRLALGTVGLSVSEETLGNVLVALNIYDVLKILSSEFVYFCQARGDDLASTFTAYRTDGGSLAIAGPSSLVAAFPANKAGPNDSISVAATAVPSRDDWLTDYAVANSGASALWCWTLYYDPAAGDPLEVDSPPNWSYALDSEDGTITWFTEGASGWNAGDFGTSTVPGGGSLSGFAVRHTLPPDYTLCGGQDTTYVPSFGETIGPSASTGIGSLKMRCDDLPKAVSDKVVTAVFPGSYYVSDQNRSSGIRVTGSLTPSEGDTVRIVGNTTTVNGEAVLQATTELPVSHITLPKPIGLTGRSLGGSQMGIQTDVLTDLSVTTPFPRLALNNIGLLIRAWGTVTQIGDGYLYINDGSAVKDGTVTGAEENIGVRVICDPSEYVAGDYLIVTGISSCFETPSGQIARRIFARRPEDIHRM